MSTIPMTWPQIFQGWGIPKALALRLGKACHELPADVLRAIDHQTVDTEAETVRMVRRP